MNQAGAAVIEWFGVSEYSAEELAGLSGHSEGSALDEAIHVLFALLGDGRVAAKTAKKLATDAGVTAATLWRAKKALGVVSQREGFGPGSRFYWKLSQENSLVRRLRAEETSHLADRLFFGGDDEDDDPADCWKKGPQG